MDTGPSFDKRTLDFLHIHFNSQDFNMWKINLQGAEFPTAVKRSSLFMWNKIGLQYVSIISII